MLKHQEEYNIRLFRKSILERGLDNGISVGNFKNLENTFIRLAFISRSDNAVPLADLKRRKTDDMKNELQILKVEMDALDKAIVNIRLEVKSITSKKIYEKWTKTIHDSIMKFQKLFAENNELVYKMSEEYDETFGSIMNDIDRSYRNIFELSQNYKEKQVETNGRDVEDSSNVV